MILCEFTNKGIHNKLKDATDPSFGIMFPIRMLGLTPSARGCGVGFMLLCEFMNMKIHNKPYGGKLTFIFIIFIINDLKSILIPSESVFNIRQDRKNRSTR